MVTQDFKKYRWIHHKKYITSPLRGNKASKVPINSQIWFYFFRQFFLESSENYKKECQEF